MRARLVSSLLTGFAVLLWMVVPGPLFTRDAAAQSCTPIATANDLVKIKRNLAGNYCLANDIDLAGVANFQPIGGEAAFTGTFDGQGHVIRNLTITSRRPSLGLFFFIDGGTVSNLTLAGVTLDATAKGTNGPLVGALTGAIDGGATISNVRATGTITCTPKLCRAGGLVGEMFSGTIQSSSSDVAVTSGHGGAAGGLAGEINGAVIQSYATGVVGCPSNCAAGGLVGQVTDLGSIESSFATGPVHVHRNGNAGGLVGTMDGPASGSQGATVMHAYATGSVTTGAGEIAAAFAGTYGGPATEVFGLGKVRAGNGITSGGAFAASEGDPGTASAVYWDTITTRQSFSVAGEGKRTGQLQAKLPAGFGASWAITKGYSYPYLNLLDSGMFASTLASVRYKKQVYAFVPLGQLEPTEYNTAPVHADATSLAAVYTMLARGIGRTAAVDAIANTKIDQFFWDDSAQSANFAGPVTSYAELGSVIDITSGQPIDDSNIIGAVKARKVVIIRGTASDASMHWMLATGFTSDSGGATTALVANDPWTGSQIRIDPTTKQVSFPVSFPIAGFTVDQYQVVTQTRP